MAKSLAQQAIEAYAEWSNKPVNPFARLSTKCLVQLLTTSNEAERNSINEVLAKRKDKLKNGDFKLRKPHTHMGKKKVHK